MIVVPSGDGDQSLEWYPAQDAYRPPRVDQETVSRGQWPQSQIDWNAANMPESAFGTTADTNGERGLYWLWDMSWNGVHL
jgi:hypothetical protein